MIPGETISTGAPNRCPTCEALALIRVCHSGGGYYLGSWCDCGPYSRESTYFRTEYDATIALRAWQAGERWMLR